MSDSVVRVTGLRELQGAFKQVDKELPKALRVRFLGVAQHVVDLARSWMPEREGIARASVRASGTTRGAGITFPGGGNQDRDGYYPWLDFGGSTGRGHIVGTGGSGAIKRPMVKGGRYIYPAIADSKAETIRATEQAIHDVAVHAGFAESGS